MRYTIVHPSRGRPKMALETALQWIQKRGANHSYEYVLSIDTDDPLNSEYKKLFADIVTVTIVERNNNNVVQAMNAGAVGARGDILVCISDDFDCPLNWGNYILSLLDITKPRALRINDGYAKADNVILTLPIMTRVLYEKLGYVYYPEYSGMYADNDLAELCEQEGWLVKNFTQIFQHNHFANGRAKKDATYLRHNNPEGWALGQKIIADRRAYRFGVKQEILLSVLIPTIPERYEQLRALTTHIINNLKRGGFMAIVEVGHMTDKKLISIGRKRQLLNESASGKYVWQIDDDDWISADAFEYIIPILKNEQPDCVCFLESCNMNGVMKTSIHSNRYEKWQDNFDGYDYVRTPFYKDVIKREIALKIGIEDMRYAEDHDFSIRLKESGLIEKETFLNKIIYEYYYIDKIPHNEKYGIKNES